MRLDVGCRLTFEAPWPTGIVLMVSPQSGEAQNVVTEQLVVDPATHVRSYHDSFGNLCHRLTLPTGRTTVAAAATVDVGDEIDVDPTAPRSEFETIPDWVLEYCLPSRYCPSDTLYDLASTVTAGALPGYPQVEAIRAWIASTIRYEYGTSSSTTSALDTIESRAGVCRDFAHLGIALCRALQIPARMVVGYLHELVPMDAHAWFEAFVGDRWYTFDATQPSAKGNRVAVAYGRDAADVALVTQFGPVALTEMYVSVDPA
ncbi:transglutaminase domain-containing protein [Desertimonas flava]|uniref:transglutaminase domain-containing protein n=1 Tax=Desertimonas flava TaxID=2064846 RepID=UPI000E353D82|nr:transglutaminase family protein [Desertimonas flava]